ncbi:MAG TPA: hypothetical protein VGB74_10005 [Actinoplanes sp.]
MTDRLWQAVVDFAEHHDDRLLLDGVTRAQAEALPLADATAAALLAMYMTCHHEALRDRDPAILLDLDWPMQVLAAGVSQDVPEPVRALALTVARLVSPEAELRSALRELTAALIGDDPAALDAALVRAQHAARTPDLPARLEHQCWHRIAAGWARRYQATGRPSDLDDALAASERDMAIVPDADRAEAAATHARLLVERMRHGESVRDLEDLAEHSRDAGLEELAGPLRYARLAMFRRTGDPVHLDEVLRLGGDVLQDPSLTGEDHSMLGRRLQERYRRDRVAADVDAAVACGRQSVRLPHAGPVDLAGRLANLLDALALRADLGRDAGASDDADAFLDEALEVATVAIELLTRAPEPATGPPGVLAGLRGDFLVRRWQLTHARADLDAGIDQLIAAAEAAAAGGAPSAQYRQAAANALLRRFHRRRHAADLDAALRQLDLAGPAADPALRQAIGKAQDNPPRLFIPSDGSQGLPSPHALANLHAWNRGRPRTSGLLWVHTADGSAS